MEQLAVKRGLFVLVFSLSLLSSGMVVGEEVPSEGWWPEVMVRIGGGYYKSGYEYEGDGVNGYSDLFRGGGLDLELAPLWRVGEHFYLGSTFTLFVGPSLSHDTEDKYNQDKEAGSEGAYAYALGLMGAFVYEGFSFDLSLGAAYLAHRWWYIGHEGKSYYEIESFGVNASFGVGYLFELGAFQLGPYGVARYAKVGDLIVTGENPSTWTDTTVGGGVQALF